MLMVLVSKACPPRGGHYVGPKVLELSHFKDHKQRFYASIACEIEVFLSQSRENDKRRRPPMQLTYPMNEARWVDGSPRHNN